MGNVAPINPDHEKARARKRAAALAHKATPAMVDYLTILLNHFFGTRVERNGYLSRETEREIKYVDELTFDETKRLIEELKERRSRK